MMRLTLTLLLLLVGGTEASSSRTSTVCTNVALGSLRSLTFDYDAHGRRHRVTDARTGTTTYAYDAADQVLTHAAPPPFAGQAPRATGFEYDARGRLRKTYFPGGGVRTLQYYSNGLLSTRSGALTPPVQFEYDPAGRLRHTVTWTNAAATPNGAATNTWIYDASRGLLAARVFPDGTSNTFAYTNSGRLIARAWARGVTNRYAYNAAGELAAVDYSDATPDLAFTYDRRGRVTALTQGTNVTSFARHDAGLVLAETNHGALTLTNGYDALLRRTRVWANPDNAYFTDYGYDAASRLASVGGATYAWLTNSPLVEKVTMRYGTSVVLTTTRTYDNADRLVKIDSVPAATGPAPITFAYGYNANSQRTSVTNAEGARWAFSYDTLGQLTGGHRYWPDGAAVAGQQFDYVFDEIGNRLSTARGGDALGASLRTDSYTNNAANQLVARTVPGYVDVLGRAASNATVTLNNVRVNGRQAFEYWRAELTANNSTGLVVVGITNIGVLQDPVAAAIPTDIVTTNLTSVLLPRTPEVFKYDADGNLTNNGLWSLKWDAENRLIEMENVAAVPPPQRLKLKFAYDWQGRRVSKVVSNYATGSWQLTLARRWIWDGTRPLAELEATNSLPWLRQWYVWGADESGTLDGAGGVGGLVMISDSTPSGWSWYTLSDGRGNLAGMGDYVTGETGGWLDYSPFGEVLRAAGVAAYLPLRHSTKYEDAETGFVYYGRRYYDPVTGRWLSRDPIGEAGGLNLYGFVGNDPVNRIDPFGLQGVIGPSDSPPSFGYSIDVFGNARRTETPQEREARIAERFAPPWWVDALKLLPPEEAGRLNLLQPAFEDAFRFATLNIPDTIESMTGETGLPTTFRENAASALTLARDIPLFAVQFLPCGQLGRAGNATGRLVAQGGRGSLAADRMSILVGRELGCGRVESSALAVYWPANRGFLGQSQRDFLTIGTQIDRYGGNAGKFVAPLNTPFEARSLPTQYLQTKPYNAFEVLKPIEVDAGITAPGLGQPGLGVQYELPVSIDVLIKRGFLKPITP